MKKHSIKYYIILVFSIWLVISFGISVSAMIFSVHQLKEKVAEEEKASLRFYQSEVDRALKDTYVSLCDMVETNDSILTIQMDQDSSALALSKSALSRNLASLSASHSDISFFFVYIEQDAYGNEFFLSATNGTRPSPTLNSRDAFCSLVRRSLDERAIYPDKWSILDIDGTSYLVCFTRQRGCYVGSCINMNDLISRVHISSSDEGHSCFVTSDGLILTGTSLPETSLPINQSSTSAYTSKTYDGIRYSIINVPSSAADFSLVALIPDAVSLVGYSTFLVVLFFVFVILFLLTATILLYFSHMITKPVNALYATTEAIRAGNPDARVSYRTAVEELSTLGTSFNEMLDEAERLKISLYEQKLKERQAQLDYLQIQVHPHFFLNCLNLVYSLAELNRLEDVKKLSISLSKYFRFRFHKSTSMISLREELDHVRNYMDIQLIRFRNNLTCNIYADDSLLDALLPPLSIQTFVENSIKYAMNPKKGNVIVIRCEQLNSLMKVTVRDNGKGYASDVLPILNSDVRFDKSDATSRIGIVNVKERLKLLYGENFYINFYNNNGSVMEYAIPIRKEGNDDAQDPVSG